MQGIRRESCIFSGLALDSEYVGIYPFAQESARDIFEIMEGRSHKGSVVVVSQIPVDAWYDIITDAILDRLVHNAYRIEMTGESMRKKLSPLTATKD